MREREKKKTTQGGLFFSPAPIPLHTPIPIPQPQAHAGVSPPSPPPQTHRMPSIPPPGAAGGRPRSRELQTRPARPRRRPSQTSACGWSWRGCCTWRARGCSRAPAVGRERREGRRMSGMERGRLREGARARWASLFFSPPSAQAPPRIAPPPFAGVCARYLVACMDRVHAWTAGVRGGPRAQRAEERATAQRTARTQLPSQIDRFPGGRAHGLTLHSRGRGDALFPASGTTRNRAPLGPPLGRHS